MANYSHGHIAKKKKKKRGSIKNNTSNMFAKENPTHEKLYEGFTINLLGNRFTM